MPVQHLGPVGLAEHGRGGQYQDDPGLVQDALAAPPVGGQVGDLLRGAGALDRPGGHGEDRGAAAQVADEFPGPGREVEAVVAGHAVLPERLAQAGDLAEIELDPGRHDQVVIADDAAGPGGDGLGVRVDRRGGLADPAHALGHHVGLRPHGCALRRPAPADHGEQRLVEVLARRLDHGDVALPGADQPGCRSDAGRPAADDHDRVVLCGGCAHRMVSFDWPSFLVRDSPAPSAWPNSSSMLITWRPAAARIEAATVER